MIPFALNVAAPAAAKIANALNGPGNPQIAAFPLGFCNPTGGLSHGHRQHTQKNW